MVWLVLWAIHRRTQTTTFGVVPGGKSTSSWQTVPPWRLRWRPSRKTNFSGPGRSMRGCSSNSWRHQEILKAKERVRTRGRKEARRVSTKTTWRPTPARVMARVTRPPKEVVPMDGLRTGHCRHPMGSNTAGTSTSNIPAKGTAADLMLALWGSMDGRKGKAWTLLDPRAHSRHDPESGETRPTNDEPVRAPIDGTGDLADYFVPASKPQFSNPIVRPAPSGPEPTNSPEVPDDLPKPRGGESLMAPPLDTLQLQTLFPWTASLPERLKQGLLWDPSVSPYEVQKPGAFEPAIPSGGSHHCLRHQTSRGSGYSQWRPLFPAVCLSLEWRDPRYGGWSKLPDLEYRNLIAGVSQSLKPLRQTTQTMTVCSC